jgi:hypothetical protein
MRRKVIILTVLALIGLQTPAIPAAAQSAGWELDPVYLVGGGAFAEITVNWESNQGVEFEIDVQDNEYDGWCAVLSISAEYGYGGYDETYACGYGTGTHKYEWFWSEDPVLMQSVDLQLSTYYPPTGEYVLQDEITLYNPHPCCVVE